MCSLAVPGRYSFFTNVCHRNKCGGRLSYILGCVANFKYAGGSNPSKYHFFFLYLSYSYKTTAYYLVSIWYFFNPLPPRNFLQSKHLSAKPLVDGPQNFDYNRKGNVELVANFHMDLKSCLVKSVFSSAPSRSCIHCFSGWARFIIKLPNPFCPVIGGGCTMMLNALSLFVFGFSFQLKNIKKNSRRERDEHRENVTT